MVNRRINLAHILLPITLLSLAVLAVSAEATGLPAWTARAPYGSASAQQQMVRMNVALSANGGVAIASSEYGSNWGAIAAINGDRRGYWYGNPATQSGWNSGGDGPQWLEVNFDGQKNVDEINVITLQDNAHTSPVEPTLTQTFTRYGLTDFEVQYWNGSDWVTVPDGSVTGNQNVWRQFTFPAVTTSKIRVLSAGTSDYSRIVELEAWGPNLGPPPPTPTPTPVFQLQRMVPAPAAAPIAALVTDSTGVMTPGAHRFKVTYLTSNGETTPSEASNAVVVDTTRRKVSLTLPTHFTAFEHDMDITAWRVYATKANGTAFFRVVDVPYVDGGYVPTGPMVNNTYVFNFADSSFASNAPPTENTALVTALFVDEYGSVGMGYGANPLTPVLGGAPDDDQGLNFTMNGGSSYSYLNIGANKTNFSIDSRVGAINFFNLAQGGVDHRLAAIMAFHDGAVATGRLEFYTANSILGPNKVGAVDSGGRWSFGPKPPAPTIRARFNGLSNDDKTYIIAADNATGAGVFYLTSTGKLSLGSNPNPAGRLTIGNNDFVLNDTGFITSYGGKVISNGQLLIGNGQTRRFETSTLVAGPGITITNTQGLLTISATGGGTSSGTSSSSMTADKGDLIIRSSDSEKRLGAGADGQVLTADSTQPTGVKWATPPSGGASTVERVKVRNSADIAVPSHELTLLTFDTEKYDSNELHSTASETSRLVAKQAGAYILTAQLTWSNYTAGSVRDVRIRKNGTTIIADIKQINDEAMSLTVQDEAEAGDYYEVLVYQDSGFIINLISSDAVGSGAYSAYFSMMRLGQ